MRLVYSILGASGGFGSHLGDWLTPLQAIKQGLMGVDGRLITLIALEAIDVILEHLDEHPLRKYFDAGLKVSLNTDNRLMSGTDLVTEYGLAAKHQGFTFEELCKLARGGFENAFLPEAERHALLARVDAEIATLTGFTDQSHFTKRFRQTTGLTPDAYRKRFQRRPEP